MPEEPTGAGAPQPQQPAEGQQPDAGSGQPSSPTPDTPKPDGTGQPSANKLIKDFAAERGISVEELLGKYQELEDAGKSATERLEDERDRYKTEAERLTDELRNVRSESAFLEAAREARARAPKTLFRAFRDQLEYDKAGNPTNIAEVIAAAKDDEPDLFHAATGSSDAGRRGDGTGTSLDANWLFRELAERQR